MHSLSLAPSQWPEPVMMIDAEASQGPAITVAARARALIIGVRYGLPLYFARTRRRCGH